jgi:hypothetical protein
MQLPINAIEKPAVVGEVLTAWISKSRAVRTNIVASALSDLYIEKFLFALAQSNIKICRPSANTA